MQKKIHTTLMFGVLAFDCGPLTLAVIADDLDQVRQILTRFPTAIAERNLAGQTPIHFAVDKPDCLQLLLRIADDTVLNSPDNWGQSPAEYALGSSGEICRIQDSTICDAQCPCVRGLEILIDADCALRFPQKFDCEPSRRAVIKYANGMKNRRDRLKFLALEHLPPLESERLGLKEERVIDAEAFHVIERLRACNVATPTALTVSHGMMPYTTLYHSSPLYQSLGGAFKADFFELGFVDIDTVDEDGFPPLATHRPRLTADRLWLVEHGRRLFHRLEYTVETPLSMRIPGATSAHWIFYFIGWNFRKTMDRACSGTEVDATAQLNALILPGDALDGCCCKCSFGGCSPYIWMLKSALKVEKGLGRFMWSYISHFGLSMERKHHREAIRFITFEALHIPHTCCGGGAHARLPYNDQEDIREMEEEHAVLLGILEDLVEEFEDKITGILEQGTANMLTMLAEFWTGYWDHRMSGVRRELDGHDISQEERIGAEKIGVVWDDGRCEKSEEDAVEYDWGYELGNIKSWYRLADSIA